jgi:hypothetical protein
MTLARGRPQPPTRIHRLLRPPSVLNIGVYSVPFDDLSGCIGDRARTEEEPAIIAVEPPQARFHFTWLARSQNGTPTFQELRQVFEVDRSLPAPATGLGNAKAGVFAPALIEEVDMPVGKRSPYQSGKHIDDATELVLHSGPFATVAVRMRLSTGERRSYLGVGLRSGRDVSPFEKIVAPLMAFQGSRMLPRQRVLLKSILDVAHHACLLTSFSNNRMAMRCASEFARRPRCPRKRKCERCSQLRPIPKYRRHHRPMDLPSLDGICVSQPTEAAIRNGQRTALQSPDRVR